MEAACKRGHIGERGARNQCLACKRQWIRENRERHAANVKAFRDRDRDHARELDRQHKARHPAKVRFDRAMKRARALHAVPSWVDRRAIRAVYEACPPGMEVDHIVPLASNVVTGLHVPWNLQYLTRSDNARKGRRLMEA